LTVERDGDTVTITRPDGTTEQFTIGEDAPLRVRSHDGAVIVEEDDGAHRRIEVRRHGAPRAFAFDADGPPGSLRMALDLDSLAQEIEGMRWLSRDVEDFAFEHVLPGLRLRGVDSETRRGIADGSARAATSPAASAPPTAPSASASNASSARRSNARS